MQDAAEPSSSSDDSKDDGFDSYVASGSSADVKKEWPEHLPNEVQPVLFHLTKAMGVSIETIFAEKETNVEMQSTCGNGLGKVQTRIGGGRLDALRQAVHTLSMNDRGEQSTLGSVDFPPKDGRVMGPLAAHRMHDGCNPGIEESAGGSVPVRAERHCRGPVKAVRKSSGLSKTERAEPMQGSSVFPLQSRDSGALTDAEAIEKLRGELINSSEMIDVLNPRTPQIKVLEYIRACTKKLNNAVLRSQRGEKVKGSASSEAAAPGALQGKLDSPALAELDLATSSTTLKRGRTYSESQESPSMGNKGVTEEGRKRVARGALAALLSGMASLGSTARAK